MVAVDRIAIGSDRDWRLGEMVDVVMDMIELSWSVVDWGGWVGQ